MNFFAELKRRNVYKVAVAYVVAGWALSQGIAQVLPVFDIPNWIIRLIVVLIIIGLPIALVLAWSFEITPQGIKRTEDVDLATAAQQPKKRTWIFVVIIGALVSIGLFFLGRYTASSVTSGEGGRPGGPSLPQKSIAETLQARLTGSEKSSIAKTPTVNPEAYELYLKGRFFWNKRTGDDLRKSIEYFNQAISKDPNYALAYAGLADSYLLLPNYGGAPTADVVPPARTAVTRALELDDSLAEAYASLGLLDTLDLRLERAITHLERAVQLKPNYATAHHWLGLRHLSLRHFDQAIAEGKRHTELDPLSVIINADFAWTYACAHRLDEAEAQARRTLE